MQEFGFSAGLELTDGKCFSTNERVSEVDYENDSVILKFPGSSSEPEFIWEATREKSEAFSIRLQIKNTTDLPLSAEKIILFGTSVPGHDIRASMTGYETESPSHPPLPLSKHERLLAIAKKSPSRVGSITLSEEDAVDAFPWMTQIIDGHGRHMLIGFTTAKEQAGYIKIEPRGSHNDVTAFTVAEGIEIAPRACMMSEKVLVSFERDRKRALQAYAQIAAEDMNAIVWKDPLKGGVTWYWHGREKSWGWKVNEQDIKRYLDTLERFDDQIPIDHLILDDTYDPEGHVRLGDRVEDRKKFPSGYKDLIDYVHAKGKKILLWDASFLASSASELYRNHPEWFMKDRVMQHWDGDIHALDLSNEEAQEALRNRMREIRELGFDGVKIDFQYPAAARSERMDKKMTGIAALRKGLEIIAEEMQDKLVIHCGAPLLPVVGYASVVRIGPDSAAYWVDPNREGTASSIKYAERSVDARSWMDGVWFRNDPDCVIVRKHDSQLTDAERASWMTRVALSGVVFLGDDVSRLEKEQINTLSRLFPPHAGEKPMTLEHDHEGMATKVHMKIERPWDTWHVAALFNRKDTAEDLVFHQQEWGLDENKTYHVFDQWEGEYVGTSTSFSEEATLHFPTPSHGVKVLSVCEDKGRPQVVGSTMHLLGNAVGVEGESWEENCLQILLKGGKEGKLAIYVPEGYKLEGEYEREGRIVKVDVGKVCREFIFQFKVVEPFMAS